MNRTSLAQQKRTRNMQKQIKGEKKNKKKKTSRNSERLKCFAYE